MIPHNPGILEQARYDNLRTAIMETRQAQHDMRHHFNILQSLARQRKRDSLEKYLSDAREILPDTELGLCDNTAVDSGAVNKLFLRSRTLNQSLQ